MLVASAAKSQEKKVNIVPFPVIATNPTVGFVFGFSPGLTWYMGDKENTSMSSVVTSLVYTTNKQILFNLRGNSFLDGLKRRLRKQQEYLPTIV